MTTKNTKNQNAAMTPAINSDSIRKAIKGSIAKNKQMEISGETIKPTLPEKEEIPVENVQAPQEPTPEIGDPRETDHETGTLTLAELEYEKLREDDLALYNASLQNEFETPAPEFLDNPFYNSHQFVKNGISEPYKSPKDLLSKLIPYFGDGGNLILEGSYPVTISENDEIKTAYARGMIVKSFVLDAEDEITYEVGFLYAYDLGTPIFKVFSGAKVRACSNLCIFQADDIQTYKIMENAAGSYEQVRIYMENITDKIDQARQTIQMLKSTHLNKRQLTDFFGQLLFNFQAVENVAGITCITDAAKELQNPKGRNFFDTRPKLNDAGERVQATTSCWNVYNSLTNKFAKKEILDQPAKVLSIFKEVQPLIYAN